MKGSHYFLTTSLLGLLGCNPVANVTVSTSTGDIAMNCSRPAYLPEESIESFVIMYSGATMSYQRIITYDRDITGVGLRVNNLNSANYPFPFTVSDGAALAAINDCRETFSSWDNPF
jgi:hypothetical protein